MEHVICVDWGTSHLRAYLCQVKPEGGLELLEIRLGLGVTKCGGHFEAELIKCIGSWSQSYGKLPILMAGQIGSSIGWKEAVYLPCPVKPEKIAGSCLQFDCHGYQISIVPGVCCLLNSEHEDNHDVMRGEELQVLGWLELKAEHRIGRHLLCLPGTHTKWVLIVDGEIQLFKTAMTGELFDLLSTRSVLIQHQTKGFDRDSFALGARYTLNSELGNFSHGIFSVRSKQLFGELNPTEASSYLSGLLIGSDVRAAINANEWNLSKAEKVAIIGAEQLSQRFADVLTIQEINSYMCEVNKTTLLGFAAVYQAMHAVIT